MKQATLFVIAFLTLGCSQLTEIMVVIDSDLAVPTELDAVEVEVTGSQTMSATGDLTIEGLPRTVGVAHSGGPLGPITIRVTGSRGGGVQVERIVETSFISGRTLFLPITLTRDCMGTTCAAGETCVDGACTSPIIDSSTLDDWRGSIPTQDAGGCVPAAEVCNGVDDDCDGNVDETIDLTTDAFNCGRCGQVCSAANASSACVGGVCAIGECAAGFASCDGDAATGCEASLTSTTDCGACGTACSVPGGTGDCSTSTCEFGSCDLGFDDCNMDIADGCEATVTSLTDCGACGVACAIADGTATCDTGVCAVDTCNTGFDDCNMDATDGCEADVTTLTDCGACGVACAATDGTPSCDTGTCEVVACDGGFSDCNDDPADGCEAMVGDACPIVDGTGTCAALVCEVTACDTDRDDCNMDPSDGCETNTRSDDMNCGTCGNVCAAGDNCRRGTCR